MELSRRLSRRRARNSKQCTFFLSSILILSSLSGIVSSFCTIQPFKRNVPSVSRSYETYCRNIITKKGEQTQCWDLSRLSTRLYDGLGTETETKTTLMEGTETKINGNILNGLDKSTTLPSMISSIAKDVPMPTENGGYTHTTESKAKISAANKGKTPWNKGKKRSEETKARIAAGVRAKNRERFLQKLKDMGLTEEEYEAQKKEERRKKEADKRARRTAKGGYRPTEETKAKISKILKEKFKNGEIKPRKIDPNKVRKGFKHSDETKAKISESLRKRWANDPDYREKMKNQVKKANTKEETRARISATLKKKWQDPDFRSKMMEKINSRQTNFKHDDAHREKISQAMKKKWQDEEYRSKALKSIQRRKNPEPATRTAKRKSAVKGSTSSKAADVRMVEPIIKGGAKKTKTAKRKRKKVIRLVEKGEDVVSATTVTKVTKVKPTTKGKKASPKKQNKKKKEPDGSVNRLREERRDLFDLLYGDEDDEANENEAPQSKDFSLGDEDLDSFDPYGLDDY